MLKTRLDKLAVVPGRTAYCVETLELKRNLEIGFLDLGRRLKDIAKGKLWAGKWDSWEEYLADLQISPASASKLVRIYSLLIEEHGFDPRQIAAAGGWTVVAEILPEIKDRREAEEWLHLAGSLSRVDLRRTLTERRKGSNMLTCRHEHTFLLRICPDCGLRTREMEPAEADRIGTGGNG